MSANRLREAREYVGVMAVEAAGFAGVPVERLRSAEAGECGLRHHEWIRLSRLYSRPVGWQRGEPSPPIQIGPELAGLMERLPENDRSEVVAFAEFLQHRSAADADR